jgi:predicted DCC family thiol-disulfide oxidoreductase YuxK
MSAPAAPAGERALVLYDGLCGLCDVAVQWLLRHDRRAVLVYAPLQGETARPYLALARGDGGERGLSTMVFVERGAAGDETITTRSRGFFRIVRRLGGPWSLLAALRVLPAFLTDAIYDFVSRRRTRWFGRLDACKVPDAASKARFLP